MARAKVSLDVGLLAASAGGEDLALDLTEEIPLPAAELGAEDDAGELLRVVVDPEEEVRQERIRSQDPAPSEARRAR